MKKIEIAEFILQQSSAFKNGRINYTRKNGDLIIWDDRHFNSFYETELLDYFKAFKSYLIYNEAKNRCELIIYS